MSTSLRTVDPRDQRLAHFNAERDRIVADVEQRVLTRLVEAAQTDEQHSLEYVLNDVAYAEIRRHEHSKSRKGKSALARWRDLALRLGRMSPEEKRRELRSLVGYYVRDIVGNFNPQVYRFANGVIPPALSVLFSPMSSVKDGLAAVGQLESQMQTEGEIELIRKMCERGTVIYTPTHSSNLDSIVLGFALSRSGLPPVTYGAGKNLFSNPFISFFMYNLGAYRVDRRLRFSLYKDVLKEYSTVLLERGFHSLFFPGGTRSRSNIVEERLKLGLLGTGLSAVRHSVRADGVGRPIYVVPVTINYRLVLEAETLIEDYLEETGRSRYIIEDDEFSRLGRMIEFFRKLMVHDGAVRVRFGRPVDTFGNDIDDDGNSLDRRGRIIDPVAYLRDAAGEVVADDQRDGNYTRALGVRLASEFRRHTVFSSTPIVCRAVFDALVARSGIRDVYRLLRLPPSAVSVERADLCRSIDRVRQTIIEHPEWGRVTEQAATAPAEKLLNEAIHVLGTYHTRPVLMASGDRVRVGYMKLLYYYRNRTDHVEVPA